ncbi:MAG: hypothetical protein ACWGQW_14125 [bacterium]
MFIESFKQFETFNGSTIQCIHRLKESEESADKDEAMPATGIDSDISPEQLGKLGALLSNLELNLQKSPQDSSAVSVSDLKGLISSIENSIGDLEEQIGRNEEEQRGLAAASQKLKQEIQELSSKLTVEVSALTKITASL